jgi:hypothetical protein
MIKFATDNEKTEYARDAFKRIRTVLRKADNYSLLLEIENICAWDLRVISEVSEKGHKELTDLLSARKQEFLSGA